MRCTGSQKRERDDSRVFSLYIKYKGANDNESSCCQSPMVVFCSRPIEEKMTNHNFLTSSFVDRKEKWVLGHRLGNK